MQHRDKAEADLAAWVDTAYERGLGDSDEMAFQLDGDSRQITKLKADLAAAREALGKLTAKLTAIEGDKSFQGIWVFLHAHGFQYTGPDWRDDLADARAFLERTAAAAPQNAK
jgi:hypothetical protein